VLFFHLNVLGDNRRKKGEGTTGPRGVADTQAFGLG
jgi:hypothetical protein